MRYLATDAGSVLFGNKYSEAVKCVHIWWNSNTEHFPTLIHHRLTEQIVHYRLLNNYHCHHHKSDCSCFLLLSICCLFLPSWNSNWNTPCGFRKLVMPNSPGLSLDLRAGRYHPACCKLVTDGIRSHCHPTLQHQRPLSMVSLDHGT